VTLFFRGSSVKRWYGDTLADAIRSRGESSSVSYEASPRDAVSVTAAGAAINLVTDICAMLPVDEYEEIKGLQSQVTADSLVSDPLGNNSGWRPFAASLGAELASNGNAVLQIVERSTQIRPTVLRVVPMHCVRHQVEKDRNLWWFDNVPVDDADVRVIALRPRAGHVFGLSPLAQFAASNGLALHAHRFLGQFYADGGHPSSVITSSGNLTREQANDLKQGWLATFRNKREPAVLSGGLTYSPTQLSPVDADLLASMKWSASEVARAWGPGMAEILGYESGSSMTYANIESRMLHLLTLTLDPYLCAIEHSISLLLPNPRRIRINRGALLRTDLSTRYAAHELGIRSGFQTINEVRAIEDMPPVPWGDQPPPQKVPTMGMP